MRLSFYFFDELNGVKFAQKERREKACRMLGSALLKQAAAFVAGRPQLLHSIEGSNAIISLNCTFEGVGPETLNQVNAFLKEVVRVINSMNETQLDSPD